MPEPRLLKEASRLRAVMSNPHHRIRITNHARKEMENDDIRADDIDLILSQGRVTWFEVKRDELLHVEGVDVDGRRIRLVVAVYDDELVIKLITAMKLG